MDGCSGGVLDVGPPPVLEAALTVFRSAEFRISRLELAYLCAGEYARKFWFLAVVPPLTGLLIVLFLPIVAPLGFVGLLWPLSLPARALLASRRASRLFARGCHAEGSAEGVVFYGPASDAPRLRWRVAGEEIRAVRVRPRFVVLELRRFEVVPIRREALDEGTVSLLDTSM